MLSNKLTFSLASLVMLIALGFVFGTGSVLAHNDSGDATHDADVSTAHPLVESIVLDKAVFGESGDFNVTVTFAAAAAAPTVNTVTGRTRDKRSDCRLCCH